MKIKISLDNLDTAIKQLEALEEKIRQFPGEVARESARRTGYKLAVADIQDGRSRVIASSPQIAFEEFGAGFDAQTVDIGSFHTEPGSYSRDPVLGKGTFDQWIASGKPPEQYPYNRTPQKGMQKEAKRLISETKGKAERYFGK